MTKYLIFFLKYYPNCVSILYKKCCRVVLLTKKRTFFTIVFFCKCFELCTFPSRDLFPHFFSNVQCRIIKKHIDLNRSGSRKISNRGLAVLTSRYRSVNTARPRLDISPYCMPSLSVSKLLLFAEGEVIIGEYSRDEMEVNIPR